MLDPLYTAISWALLRWHSLWAAILGDASSLAWGLSIVFLVITLRIILFPLFVKQIKSQRAMQELSPKIKELQAKYKGDKETQQREMMALYKEHGANPIAGCLPIFLQAPVFISLYHVLKRLNPSVSHDKTLYSWTSSLFDSASNAKIFGAPISGHFTQAFTTAGQAQLKVLGASRVNVALVAGVLVVIMVATTYITQRQMIARQKTSGQAQDDQQAMIQKLMLFGIPVVLLFTGTNFPLGVVIYWCTTNVWSMVQQFYVLHRMPMTGAAQPVADAAQRQAARERAPRPGVKPDVQKRVKPAPAGPPSGTASASAPSAPASSPAKPTGAARKAPAKAGQSTRPANRPAPKKRKKR